MHFVTVRLDRIFDVVHQVSRGQENTLFGFQYGTERVFGICIQGRHVLEAGAVLTACLKTENDWATLVGWYNHSTGATVVESAAHNLIFTIVMAAILTVWLWGVDAGSVAPMLALLAMGVASTGCIHSVLFVRRVRAGLARVKSLPVPTLILAPVAGPANGAVVQHCTAASASTPSPSQSTHIARK